MDSARPHGTAGPEAPTEAVDRARANQDLARRIRELVAGAVPAGATVLVATKGDGELLKLPGRRGWHFPQDDRGVYAGHHPGSGEDAVAHLEALRQRGAGYLLLPQPQLWWLDHYAILRDHLERAHRLIRRDGAGALYELRNTRSASPAAESGQLDTPDHLADLVAALLPPDAPVAVAVGPEEPRPLFRGHPVVEIPVGPAGGPSAQDRVEEVRRRGVRFLAATRAAVRADPSLERGGDVVTAQQHAGLIVDLDPEPASAVPLDTGGGDA